MKNLHPLLRRQLKKWGLQDLSAAPSLESFNKFILRINSTYVTADQDRYTYERALDVSSREMRELNEEARIEKEAAQRADQAKSEFLANMSHEMRTPIHGMLGFVDVALNRIDTASREKLGAYLRSIDESGRRLLALIDNLLDLSKLESRTEVLSLVSTNLGHVVGRVINEFTTMLDSSNLNILHHGGFDIEVRIDREKIMQVIRNLLSNALKFSPENGVIEVEVERKTGRVQVSVADRGVGIPPDELKAIFDKFVQSSKTKSGAGGTGLGLAICWKITELHGGRIWAENRERGGAQFILEVPLRRKVADAPCPKASNL